MWVFLIVIGTAVWVYFDAKNLGVRKGLVSGIANAGPGTWAAGVLLLWIIAFPMYLAMRPKYKKLLSDKTS